MAAGYTTSLLLNAQAKLAKRFEMPEFRREAYNLIKAFYQTGQNMFMEAELDRLKTSDQRVVESFVFAKRTVTPGSARSHNHTLAALGDSQKVTLSFTIVAGTYGVSLKLGGRNIFTQAEMLANDLLSASIAVNNTIEAAIAAYLSANKTQTNAASGSYSRFGEWDGTNFCWKIPASKEDYFFQFISEIMSINDYDVPLMLVADPAAGALASKLQKQGQANAVNLGWQFENQTIMQSRRVVDSTFEATVYAIPTGTVGMVSRIPKENMEGVETKLYTYGSMADPLGTPLTLAVHEYETGGSTAAGGGETQDVTFEYENSCDYSIVKAPLSSGANDSTIFKFVLEA